MHYSYLRTLIMLIIFFMPEGCSSINPHENFKDALYKMIGQSMDNVPTYSWPREKELIDSTPLPNGHIKNKYKYYRGTCIYIFEIDPKTRKIVGATFEGKETDCVINP